MKKKALAWIESRKTIRSCDCCGQNSWTFGEDRNYYFNDIETGILVQIHGLKTLPEVRLDFLIDMIWVRLFFDRLMEPELYRVKV